MGKEELVHKALIEMRLTIEAITRYVEQLNKVLEKSMLT